MSDEEEVCVDGKLIVLVHSYPVLWDSRLKSFRDETIKVNAWKEVAKGVHMKDDVEEVKKIWGRLRDRFGRERKKMTKVALGSAGGTKSVWPHLQAMDFLRDVVLQRRSVSNVKAKAKLLPSLASTSTLDTSSTSKAGMGSSLWNTDLLNITFVGGEEGSTNYTINDTQEASDTEEVLADEVAGPSTKPDDFFLRKRKKIDSFEKKIGDSLDEFKNFSQIILDSKDRKSKSPNYNFTMTLLDMIDKKSKAKQKRLKTNLFNMCMESSSDEEN